VIGFESLIGGMNTHRPMILNCTNGSAAPQFSATLMMLELKRLVAKSSDGAFEAR